MAMVTTARSFTPSASSNSSSGATRALTKTDCISNDSFPAGLRVLVVDDDPICLLILDRMLQRCQYKVTTCGRAADALAMLRENRNSYDVIISDVCMPDMDGFKLLELVGLEMDLPVIMMSANGETSAVMKGIKHGACDYLLKPVRIEELRNIWQHVVRKKWRSSTPLAAADDEKGRHAVDDGDHHSSANEGNDGMWKHGRKRRDLKEDEDDTDLDAEDPSTTKKPRVVWSVELHQQFVNAVYQLGIDKAVPKRILELMNVQGLTRENVASHLQKYRLYCKKIGGAAHQSGSLNSCFPVSNDSSFGPASTAARGGVGDFRAIGGSNELPTQAVLAGVLGRLNQASNLGIGNVEKSNPLQLAAVQGVDRGYLNRAPFTTAYGQTVLSDAGQCDVNPAQLAQIGALSGITPDKVPLGLSAIQQQQLDSALGLGGMVQIPGVSNFHQENSNGSALLMQALEQQQGDSRLLSKSVLTIPSNGSGSQQGISADAGVWATAISNLNGNNRVRNPLPGQYSLSSRLCSTSGACPGPTTQISDRDREYRGQQGLSTDAGVWESSLSNLNGAGSEIAGQNCQLLEIGSSQSAGPGSSERAFDVESKRSLIPNHGNVSLVNPLSASSSMAISGPDNVFFDGRIKDANSSLPTSSPIGSQNLRPRFLAIPGMKQAPQGIQRPQGTWPGFIGLNQDFVQLSNSTVRSPGCIVGGSSTNQGFPLVSDQGQGDLCGPGLNSGLASNFSTDSISVENFQSDQLTSENVLKARVEGDGWIQEPLSDELLSLVFQQQQEGLGLTE